jgi:hypothetical protein
MAPNGRKVSDDTLTYHTDPFYAECRAYGRIHEEQKKTDSQPRVAPECYGFRMLEKRDVQKKSVQEELAKHGIVVGGKEPIRAIVKEYIREDKLPDTAALDRMRQALQWLNEHGILVRDIKLGNFVNELWADFGLAWTEPHCVLDAMPIMAESWRREDLELFDDMVDDLDEELENLREKQAKLAMKQEEFEKGQGDLERKREVREEKKEELRRQQPRYNLRHREARYKFRPR